MTFYTEITDEMFIALCKDAKRDEEERSPIKGKIKISYDDFIDLLNKSKWKWEHIGDGNTLRVYSRFHGNDFEFEEMKYG